MKLIYVIHRPVVLMHSAVMVNAHVYQNIMEIHILNVVLNVYSVQIAPKIKRVSEINASILATLACVHLPLCVK